MSPQNLPPRETESAYIVVSIGALVLIVLMFLIGQSSGWWQ
jgi:hypothetical protein